MRAMGSRQWQDWLRFFDAEPSGSWHDELRWALLLQAVRSGPLLDYRETPADILPSLAPDEDAPPAVPIEVQASRMETWARAMLARQQTLGSMAAE